MELCDIGIIHKCRSDDVKGFAPHEIGSTVAIWSFVIDIPTINDLFVPMTIRVNPLCGRDEVLCRISKERLLFTGIHGFAFDQNRRFTRLL